MVFMHDISKKQPPDLFGKIVVLKISRKMLKDTFYNNKNIFLVRLKVNDL